MTTEKLQKLAKNLSGLIREKDSIIAIYFEVLNIKNKYKDYFLGLKSEVSDFIKLTFYIFSYLETGKFELAQTYFNNLFFIGVFMPDSELFRDSCDECDGMGTLICELCDGNGDINCDECDGSGNIEVEKGDYETCDNCEGSGNLNCNACNNGRIDCDDCNGLGDITTDENEFKKSTYLSWNPRLKDLVELNFDNKSPIKENVFFDLTEDSILLSQEDDHGDLKNFVLPNLYYIFYFSDEGEELFFNNSGNMVRNDFALDEFID